MGEALRQLFNISGGANVSYVNEAVDDEIQLGVYCAGGPMQ
jgi:hypothetical protein